MTTARVSRRRGGKGPYPRSAIAWANQLFVHFSGRRRAAIFIRCSCFSLFFFPLFAFFFPLRLPISLAHSLAFGYPRTTSQSLSTYLVLRRMEGNRYPAGRGSDTNNTENKKRKKKTQTNNTHTNTH